MKLLRFALFFLSTVTWAAGKGPHGGEIVTSRGSRIEVMMTPDSRQVDVYLLNLKASRVSLSLTSKQEAGSAVELSPQTPASQDPFYRGAFPGTPSAFVGLVFHVTLDNGAKKAFRMALPKDFRYR